MILQILSLSKNYKIPNFSLPEDQTTKERKEKNIVQRLNDFHERRKRKSARNERDENFQVFTVSLSPARQVAIRNFRCSRASGGASKREAALHQQGLKNGKYV